MNSFRHVDGLRAIAILAVLFYHLGSGLLPGGFAGVDVFFVLSGYLITTRILEELPQGRFSLTDFYVRRVKRIWPLYALVLLLVVASLPLFHSIAESKSILQTAQYSLFFSAQLYFSEVLGYFDVASNENPLLHLWSLGVEEQFYLLIPLALVLIHRFNRGAVVPCLAVAAAASFALAVAALLAGWKDFAFYQLPARAWELLAGAFSSCTPDPGDGRECWSPWC